MKLEEIIPRFEKYLKQSAGGIDLCTAYTKEPIAIVCNLVAKNKKEIEDRHLTEAEAIVYIHRGLRELRKKASGGAEKRIYTEVEDRFQIYRDTHFLEITLEN